MCIYIYIISSNMPHVPPIHPATGQQEAPLHHLAPAALQRLQRLAEPALQHRRVRAGRRDAPYGGRPRFAKGGSPKVMGGSLRSMGNL